MKSKIITFVFIFYILGVGLINIVSPTHDLSYSERRKFAQFPDISIDNIFNGKFDEDFEKYSLDQFIFRDGFRKVKSFIELKILNKTDNNNIYVIDGNIFKKEYPLNVDSVYDISYKINAINELFLKDMDVSFTIIPDKGYFIEDKEKYLTIDYEILESIMLEELRDLDYIDLFDVLELDDYYKTDHHWRQNKLDDVVNKIALEMDFMTDFSKIVYSNKTYDPFYGAYYGQAALNIKPDTINYLNNATTSEATVCKFESMNSEICSTGLYFEDELGSIDSYSVFLGGDSPIVTIENKNNTSGKELIIFKDSFTNSITPLLLEEYSTIKLVDLRFVSYDTLDQFIEFTDQDVLFMYSTLIINKSYILR
ncbi:DHHW family protein [Mycoplasmatota bacterium WC44]